MVGSSQNGVQNGDVNIVVMSAIDIAGELPNTRSVAPPHVVSVNALPSPTVFVTTTSQGIFGDHLNANSSTKTSHNIIIQEQSAALQSSLASSASDSTDTGKHKYTWDESVYDPILPVQCRNFKGELHKDRFGSGGRGRCILVGNDWYTPTEFEALCGRANSKDWKRSIRYGGRTIQCLINDNLLQPHAPTCSCSSCSDDVLVVSGDTIVSAITSSPVRLFTPYQRKRKQEKKKLSTSGRFTSSVTKDIKAVVKMPSRNMGKDISELASGSSVTTPRLAPPVIIDFNEQRQWWQLEEMAKNLVRQSQELQKQIEVAKSQIATSKDTALQQLRIQMESEKKEAINNCNMEAQISLSQAILEAKVEKDSAVEEAWEEARMEMQQKLDSISTDKGESPSKKCANCNREALSECTGCHRVSYCGTFCQRKDWQNHQEECGVSVLITEECVEVSCDGTE